MELPIDTPRVVTATEVASAAELLDAFSREFATPHSWEVRVCDTAYPDLGRWDLIALLTGDPAVAVALLTLRPKVWHDGPGRPARRVLRRARGARTRSRLGTARGR